MKIYIFADMEGISGITGTPMVSTGEAGFQYHIGRKYLTADVNACAKACFDAGADEVVVRDGHANGYSVLWSELTEDVELVQGYVPQVRFEALDGADGIILLGYHAMAGTPGAHLEHTFTSKGIQNIWLNGKLAGEFAIDAAIAGEHGVPVIMTSGCDKLCAEAREFCPDVVTCQVKKSAGVQAAVLLPPARAHKLIYDKTVEAVNLLKEGKFKPTTVDKPVTIRKEYVERMDRGYDLVAPRTTEATGDSVEQAFFEA